MLKALRAPLPLTYLCVDLCAHRCGEVGDAGWFHLSKHATTLFELLICFSVQLPPWGLAVGNTVPPSASRWKEICLVAPGIYLSISVHLDDWLAIYPCVAI